MLHRIEKEAPRPGVAAAWGAEETPNVVQKYSIHELVNFSPSGEEVEAPRNEKFSQDGSHVPSLGSSVLRCVHGIGIAREVVYIYRGAEDADGLGGYTRYKGRSPTGGG